MNAPNIIYPQGCSNFSGEEEGINNKCSEAATTLAEEAGQTFCEKSLIQPPKVLSI
jgi:hypothetical protein